jgi:hypothetical protein
MQAKKGKEASEYDEVDVKPKKTKRASDLRVDEDAASRLLMFLGFSQESEGGGRGRRRG